MLSVLVSLAATLRDQTRFRLALQMEILTLRHQLAVYKRAAGRPRVRPFDRIFWSWLSRVWSGWRGALVFVRPETVIAWHRQGFRLFWRQRSRRGKVGRLCIPREHTAFIQRISGDHPEWGEYEIAEKLAANVGIQHSAGTIRRYMESRQGSPRGIQTWRTSSRNHASEVWACDFLTQ